MPIISKRIAHVYDDISAPFLLSIMCIITTGLNLKIILLRAAVRVAEVIYPSK